MQSKTRYYIALGSNLGNRNQYLQNAIGTIAQFGEILKKSSVYETAAWGETNQPDFLNCVICLESTLKPLSLLEELQKIEFSLGRKRNKKWQARTIDLDILFADDLIINSEKLKIPHPFLHERKFILIPLNEIASFFVHPIFKKSVANLLSECKDDLAVKKHFI